MTEQHRISKREDVAYRQAIINQALHDFQERGIRGVTMSGISEELHISKRTLYEIYDSKEKLLLECLRVKHEINLKQMEEALASADNVLEGILRIFRLRFDESQHINPLFLAELQAYDVAKDYFSKIHQQQRADAVNFLRQGIEEGVFEPNTDFEIIYDMMAMMIDSIFSLGLLDSFSLEHTFAATVLTYFRGCATEKGRCIIDEWLLAQQD